MSISNRFGYNQTYIPISASKSGFNKLRQLQDKNESIHLIIIDEFSVISCGMLYWIDQRLREIFPSSRTILLEVET